MPIDLVFLIVLYLLFQFVALIAIIVYLQRVRAEIRSIYRMLGHVAGAAIEDQSEHERAVGDPPF